MSNRDDDGEGVGGDGRGTTEGYHFVAPPNRLPMIDETAAITASVRPKRTRPYRPEYEFYPPQPPYQRMPHGAGHVGADYWNPRPAMLPPYGMEPNMMPPPPAHYYPQAPSGSGYEYAYDNYGYPPYPGREYNDPYQISQWRARGRCVGFDSRRGRGGGVTEKPANTPSASKERANRNDYNQHFVDTGQRPQNFLRDSQLEDQYEDYPNAKRLVKLKNALIDAHATPPYYLKADLRHLDLSLMTFGTKFDVALIDPPWEECGSEEGLEAGRHCLNKWGYRRCEDIVWIKTNKNPTQKSLTATTQEARSMLQHTKEHCLMGIRGTVRRALDGHVIHANIDTDIIVSEERPLGSTEKPDQLYQIIERFCLGRRRIELFGEDHNIRPGWVTVGLKLQASNFKPAVYTSHFLNHDGTPFVKTAGRPQPGQPNLLQSSDEIEFLRPKSPSQP